MTAISFTNLIPEDDSSAIRETLYLNLISGMTESIIEAGKEPLKECTTNDLSEEW